jgi:hypothetical protein
VKPVLVGRVNVFDDILIRVIKRHVQLVFEQLEPVS